MILCWTALAWEDYLYWQQTDKKMLCKVNALIQATQRDAFAGIGKPEALKFDLIGKWSRRIDSAHRLVYEVDDENRLIIHQCRYHYS